MVTAVGSNILNKRFSRRDFIKIDEKIKKKFVATKEKREKIYFVDELS